MIYYHYSSCSSSWGDLFQKKAKAPWFQSRSAWNLSSLLLFPKWTCFNWQLDFGYDVILSRWQPWHYFTKKPKPLSFQIGSGWNLVGMFFA